MNQESQPQFQRGLKRSSQELEPLNSDNNDTTDTPVLKKHKHCKSSKSKWTSEEDEILSRAVMMDGEGNWKKIAVSLGNDRSHLQCLHRWQKVLNPSLVKGPWKEEEDQKLQELVEKCGPKDWSAIAAHIPGRIGKQCRERWFNHLSPDVRKTNWTVEEDTIIIEAHQRFGNKWTAISKLLNGRPANAIKNHWNSTLLKRIQEAQGTIPPRKDRRTSLHYSSSSLTSSTDALESSGSSEQSEDDSDDDDEPEEDNTSPVYTISPTAPPAQPSPPMLALLQRHQQQLQQQKQLQQQQQIQQLQQIQTQQLQHQQMQHQQLQQMQLQQYYQQLSQQDVNNRTAIMVPSHHSLPSPSHHLQPTSPLSISHPSSPHLYSPTSPMSLSHPSSPHLFSPSSPMSISHPSMPSVFLSPYGMIDHAVWDWACQWQQQHHQQQQQQQQQQHHQQQQQQQHQQHVQQQQQQQQQLHTQQPPQQQQHHMSPNLSLNNLPINTQNSLTSILPETAYDLFTVNEFSHTEPETPTVHDTEVPPYFFVPSSEQQNLLSFPVEDYSCIDSFNSILNSDSHSFSALPVDI